MKADEILDNKESFDFLKGADRILVRVAMKKYAKEKCKKQRELCQECIDDGYFEMTTAPEPIFD